MKEIFQRYSYDYNVKCDKTTVLMTASPLFIGGGGTRFE
jgi:hypothetical protein